MVSLEDYVRNLLREQTKENSILDYKECLGRGDRNKTELIKDICAFANSGGGLIVFGVSEHNGFPIDQPGIDSTDWNRSEIEVYVRQICESHIVPQVSLEFAQIPVSTDRFLFATKILPSQVAPHRIKYKGIKYDKSYYVRDGERCIEAEESEIRRMYYRSHSNPSLKIRPHIMAQLRCLAMEIVNIGSASAASIAGKLLFDRQLERGMVETDYISPAVLVTVNIPLLRSGESVKILLDYGFSNLEKAMLFCSYKDHTGMSYNDKDYLDLHEWVRNIGTYWPDELYEFLRSISTFPNPSNFIENWFKQIGQLDQPLAEGIRQRLKKSKLI